MLISFSVENWLSFRDEATLTLVAGRSRRHGGRLARVKKYGLRLLPIALLYGGNASGKSNFFQALRFAQDLVVSGRKIDAPTGVRPFLLDSPSLARPTRFEFELLIADTIYKFNFTMSSTAVLAESLTRVSAAREDQRLYTRRTEPDRVFHPGDSISGPEREELTAIHKRTRPNQLLLTATIDQNFDLLRPVYDWFGNSLLLIAPELVPSLLFHPPRVHTDPLVARMSELLLQLDTGIARLDTRAIPLKKVDDTTYSPDIAPGLFPPYDRIVLLPNSSASMSEHKLLPARLVPYHRGTDGSEVEFKRDQESEGTRRLLDLLPHFIGLSEAGETGRVLVIDEIDRSLHPLLTRALIASYLDDGCAAESRSQLLLTTHDVSLLDHRLFRPDELWITERDESGVSTLASFHEFTEAHHDRDLRGSYLRGRLGGIPRILFG
ncbi:MAG: ATP-binding protein [Magnetococcales bacterium]|nr:ATP-binding protein [Magnetococcales bacterium]